MVKLNKIAAISAAAVLIAASFPQTDVYADNPIVQTMYTADGAPMVYNDTFYMYTGHDEGNSSFFSMNDWRCFSSKDMKNWTDLGSPLAWTDFSWAKGEAWAAQCVERNGKFYYYVTLTCKSGGRAIGVAVADRPEGPFKDAIGKPLVGPMDGMKCIDPTVFVDDDGQAYMYWGNGDMWYVKLNDDMISCKGDQVKVDTRSGAFGGFYDEAPYLYKRGNKYYMIYAADALPQNVSYSTADSPTGPWKYGGVIMYHGGNSGTNHPGIIDYKGKTYLTYHTGTLPGGGDSARSECIEELTWSADGKIPEIKRTQNGCSQISSLDPYTRCEAETICFSSGLKTEKCGAGGMNVCDVNNGEYIKVAGADFGKGASSFTVSASSAGNGGKLEIRLDKQDGKVIGTCSISGTGGWQNWKEFSCDISGAEGVHDLYFTFSGGSGALFNMDWWKFEQSAAGSASEPETSEPVHTETAGAAEVSGGGMIASLKIKDTENSSDWSVQKGFEAGAAVYGDRDITAAAVPKKLKGAEYIRTACDSKLFTSDLAEFKTGSAVTVYVAADSRVNGGLEWLKTWTKTGGSIKTSNDVTLELFKKSFAAGETVTLGTNGGDNNSANYIVFAVKPDTGKGDINGDGKLSLLDLISAKTALVSGDGKKADVNGDSKFDAADAVYIQKYLLGSLTEFPDTAAENEQEVPPEPEKPAFSYDSALKYKAAPDSYKKDCAQQGKVEKVTYKTTVYSNNINKSAYVYLPYGYDKNKKYNIMYMMHGGGGNESSIFIESGVMKKYLDSMIMNGDIEPMIVVTPTVNNAAGSDMTGNAKNFWNELAKDVVPAVESKYSTYADSVSAADLKASRAHRAFSGFSMGSLTAWYVFLNDLDYFQYVMPLSGDCWAGSNAAEKAASVANAAKKSGYAKNEYFLMCATGTKDIAYSAMNDQINSMKKLTDTFTYTSDFSKGNLYFLLCDGGSHWWDGYIVNYIYDMLPYFFHE